MTTTVLPRPVERQPTGLSGIPLSVTLVLTIWLLLVVSLGAAGAFVGRPGTPPFAIAIGVGAPLLLFFAWLWLSQSFRDFVLSLDLRVIAGIQAWRWAGLGFLSLYAHKVLPAMFALPAGLGDMAIGFAARLRRQRRIHPLERAWHTRPHRSSQHWSSECHTSHGGPGRDQHRSDVDTAAAADSGIPRAVVPHAAHGCADAEPTNKE